MNTKLPDSAKIEVCRGDFYLMLKNAMLQAGGTSDIEILKKMTLGEVVNVLAQNGIRMVYIPDRHMCMVRISWGDEHPTPTEEKKQVEPFSGRREDFDSHIKKKQLLCDVRDAGIKKKQLLCDMRDADIDTSRDMDFSGGSADYDDCRFGNGR